MGKLVEYVVAGVYTGSVGNHVPGFPEDEAHSYPDHFKPVTEYLAHLPLPYHCDLQATSRPAV